MLRAMFTRVGPVVFSRPFSLTVGFCSTTMQSSYNDYMRLTTRVRIHHLTPDEFQFSSLQL